MKRKTDLSRPMADITFRCAPCAFTFKAAPAKIEDDPKQEHHPFAYYAACQRCGAQVTQQQQEKALIKAWAHATGPVTPEGKAATAKNLEGHPTPEETLRTRFNAMKTGLYAETAQYYPAKPDKYPMCKQCDVDRDWCAAQPACEKQTKIFMLHHAAFEQRDPNKLKSLYSNLQAAIFSLVSQIVSTIIADGVTLRAPKVIIDKDGETIVAEYIDDAGAKQTIYEIQAHPLFKPLGEFLTRNNLSLGDLGMTNKVIELEQDDLGRLVQGEQDRQLIADFTREQAKSHAALKEMVTRAQANRDSDPILIEHDREV